MTTQQSLVDAMNKANIRDPIVRNGIMAIASAEGGFGEMKPEIGYSHTSVARIREIFPSRVSSMTDDMIDGLKSNDRTWFNFIYGGDNHVGASLGNVPGTDDGYNFRGRGPIQLTGRYNYTRYAKMIGHPEIVDHPDLLTTDIELGCAVTIAYILDRYKGGGFGALMKAVGNNSDDIRVRKQAAFNDYMVHHAYDWTESSRPAVDQGDPDPGPDNTVAEKEDGTPEGLTQAQILMLQRALLRNRFNPGPLDGIMGHRTAGAVRNYQRSAGLPVTGVPDKATLSKLGVH